MNAKDKMTKARATLVMGHPFFGALALRLRMAPTDQIDTACIDGRTIFYNEKFVDKLTVNQTVGLIGHEVMHTALLHHTRRGTRKPQRWNMACDYAINPILLDNGFDLPEEGINNPKYKGWAAERIYDDLPEIPGDGYTLVVSIQNSTDPGKNGGVSDSPGSQAGDKGQVKSEENDWKVAVAAAAHVAKQVGKLPAGLERLVDELMASVLPWRDILRRFMTEKAKDDFSWARPARRLLAAGLYLPSRTTEGAVSEMAAFIDTSGSVGADELREFGSEVNGIHKEVKPEKFHIVYCDAAVNKVVTFGRDDELVLEAVGGGGTDFRPPFEWVKENVPNLKCAVYLTDGYGPFPEEPDYPVMWAINNDQVIPPWGEHLTIDKNNL